MSQAPIVPGFDLRTILDTFNLPSFALDVDSAVVAWDCQIADLLEDTADEILDTDTINGLVVDRCVQCWAVIVESGEVHNPIHTNGITRLGVLNVLFHSDGTQTLLRLDRK